MSDRTQHTGDDARAELDRLAEATLAAVRAPSVLNTQPWRWRYVGQSAELWLDPDRRLGAIDPEGRLALLSCGAALDHAVAALHAEGFGGTVQRLPDPARPNLIARLHQGPPRTVDNSNYHAIYRRRTDRRPFADRPPTAADLDAMRAAAERHGVQLRVLEPDEVPPLAEIAEAAEIVEHADPSSAAELRTWTNRPAAERDGLPAWATTWTTPRPVPVRTFGHPWQHRMQPGTGRDRGTVYAALVTMDDEPARWLAAGEALSDVWLTLTARGLAASPISDVVEIPAARTALRALLESDGYPAIAMRIGVATEPEDAPPNPARRPSNDVLGLPGNP
ncbi:Acg family FMN-binding oxidoreductase [Cryptosporangium sp. NPDC051539]|uniref:Acg family FMN-binding oxidoreductase n=1 Tax=Cryptosporangium sp. NPDC051539 TaxID=3363962 RepID=UPI0037BBFE3D